MTEWYVVHTRPLEEERALANLRRQSFEAYLPTYRSRRTHGRRVEFVRRPLFPRYLFVTLDMSRDVWRPILSTFGVSNLVRIGERPLAVPRGIVESLRANEEAATFDDALDPARQMKCGASIRVISGPFADLVGKFQGLADVERVIVLLDLLGREVNVRLPSRFVAAA
jgi:transcriptional antiterminator RfaH